MAVDASCLINRRAGIGHYTANTVQALSALLPDTEFHIFLGHRWAREVPKEGAAGSGVSGLRSRLIKTVRRCTGVDDAWRLYCHWRFAPYEKALAPDVIFAPNYLPPARCDPVVPVVHDLSHLRMPGMHPLGRVRWMNRLGPVLERAPAILTVSEFSKREIVELMAVPAEKIFVAPNGVSAAFRPPAEAQRVEVLRRLGLAAGRYFLAIGNQEPRKNLKLLIEAYSRLPPKLRDSYALVLGGGLGWGDAGLSGALAQDMIRNGQLHLLGYVPDADLPALYAGAVAFCFPSLSMRASACPWRRPWLVARRSWRPMPPPSPK